MNGDQQCLPCQKEIVNQAAYGPVQYLGMMAERIPELVKEKRLSPEDANALLRDAIALEKQFMADAWKILERYFRVVKPAW